MLLFYAPQSEMQSGTKAWQPGRPVFRLVFSADGKLLVTESSRGDYCLWNANTGKLLRRWKGKPSLAMEFGDRDRTVMCVTQLGTVCFFDAHSGKRIREVKIAGTVTAAAFLNHKPWLAVGHQNGTVQLWDYSQTKLIRQFHGHLKKIISVSASPDGKLLASSSYDDTLRLWKVSNGEQLWKCNTRTHPWAIVQSLLFSRDGKSLFTAGSYSGVRSWDTATGNETKRYGSITRFHSAIDLSPHGKLLGTAEGLDRVYLWEVSTGKKKGQLASLPKEVHRDISFSPDGETLFIGGALIRRLQIK